MVSQQQPQQNPWLAEYMNKGKTSMLGGVPGIPSPMANPSQMSGPSGAAPPGVGLPPAGPAEFPPNGLTEGPGPGPGGVPPMMQPAVPMETHPDPGASGPGQPHGRNILSPGDSAEIRMHFQRTHGRQPTTLEQRMIMATPALTRQLGRAPTRVEMLQYGLPRDAAVAPAAEFEVM